MMWQSLGFKDSPYNTRPLNAIKDDVELLVGREQEAIEFFTTLDSAKEGVYILSGSPGVGKTSFLNIQQYRLLSQETPFGPSLLCAYKLCAIQPNDRPNDIALRAVECLYRSVEQYCTNSKKDIPKETKKIGGWLRQDSATGFDLGLNILGFGGNFGRQVQIPSMSQVSFEGIQDVINCVTSEIVNELGLQGAFIILDNIENLSEQDLSEILLIFRDTLFTIPRIWWVIIGQSGLSSLISSLSPKVFQRLNGSLELRPLSLDEIEEAITLRVARFQSLPSGKAPLPSIIHKKLFDASNGEIRFIFKYSEEVCKKFITQVRQSMTTMINKNVVFSHKKPDDSIKKAIDDAIGRALVNKQIPVERGERTLQEIVRDEFDGLHLKLKEKQILQKMNAAKTARAKEFKKFGCKSMQDFSSNYLSKFYAQNLLSREQEGRAVTYKLRGVTALAAQYELLK